MWIKHTGKGGITAWRTRWGSAEEVMGGKVSLPVGFVHATHLGLEIAEEGAQARPVPIRNCPHPETPLENTSI